MLDFGCGTGTLDALIAPYVGTVAGVDVSSGLLDAAAKANPDLDYRHYDSNTLPYEDHTFDLAFASCVFHHIEPGERAAAAAELARVLRPGGVVAVYEHNPAEPADASRRVAVRVRRGRRIALTSGDALACCGRPDCSPSSHAISRSSPGAAGHSARSSADLGGSRSAPSTSSQQPRSSRHRDRHLDSSDRRAARAPLRAGGDPDRPAALRAPPGGTQRATARRVRPRSADPDGNALRRTSSESIRALETGGPPLLGCPDGYNAARPLDGCDPVGFQTTRGCTSFLPLLAESAGLRLPGRGSEVALHPALRAARAREPADLLHPVRLDRGCALRPRGDRLPLRLLRGHRHLLDRRLVLSCSRSHSSCWCTRRWGRFSPLLACRPGRDRELRELDPNPFGLPILLSALLVACSVGGLSSHLALSALRALPRVSHVRGGSDSRPGVSGPRASATPA